MHQRAQETVEHGQERDNCGGEVINQTCERSVESAREPLVGDVQQHSVSLYSADQQQTFWSSTQTRMARRRSRTGSMNAYVRQEEQEVVLRDVVGGKTAKPIAHHVRSIVGDRGVRKERAMRIPTAPSHRPAGGGSSAR